MDYEPLDGSVVSIDTTLNDGFVADDLNVSSFEETVTVMKMSHFDQYTKETYQNTPATHV